MLEMLNIKKYRVWEQYSSTGSRNIENYGRLLSYLANVRSFQRDLGCGRVYSSTYLGVQPKGDTLDKRFILVIEMMLIRGSTYKNRPINHVRIVLGGYRTIDGKGVGQVVVNLHDFNDLTVHEKYVFNCSDPVETVRPIIDEFVSKGLAPVESSDYIFGQYRVQLQYVYDGITNPLSDDDMRTLQILLRDREFVFVSNRCKKQFSNFVLSISRKNVYGSFVLALQDLEEKYAIHWSLKSNELVETVDGILELYKKWKE